MGENEPGIVRFSDCTMHLTYGDDVDSLVLEFRTRPSDYKPTVAVTGWGEPVPRRATVRTFDDDASLGTVREIVEFSRRELREEVRRADLEGDAVDTRALDPGAPNAAPVARESTDPARHPGVDFLEPGTGVVLATIWRVSGSTGAEIRVRAWDEVELRAFDAMATEAERSLPGGTFSG